MLMEIAAETIYVSARIGKAALGAAAMGAVGKVPRHDFVPVELQPYAYANVPLPIGFDKTISQPFIVALMTDLLDVGSKDVVLEIGTGMGYQAAVLAELARKVYSVEIIEELAQEAKLRLGRQGYKNIEFKLGNGYYGWPEHAPFDRIMVTAAKGEYRAIEIRVEKGPIVFDHVVVHFGNGSSDPIAIRSRIPAGGKTRVIDLPGNHRVIESVEFWYERGSLVSEKPRVRLWGLH